MIFLSLIGICLAISFLPNGNLVIGLTGLAFVSTLSFYGYLDYIKFKNNRKEAFYEIQNAVELIQINEAITKDELNKLKLFVENAYKKNHQMAYLLFAPLIKVKNYEKLGTILDRVSYMNMDKYRLFTIVERDNAKPKLISYVPFYVKPWMTVIKTDMTFNEAKKRFLPQ